VAAIEQPAAIDPEKLMGFVFRAVAEVGATLNTALVVMGDRLGLYRALAAAGWPEVRPDTARGPIGGHGNVPAPSAGPPPGLRINGGAVDAVVSRRGGQPASDARHAGGSGPEVAAGAARIRVIRG
jgi:hypothetical protein